MEGEWLEPMSQQLALEMTNRFILLAKMLFKDCVQLEWKVRQKCLVVSHAHYYGHDLTSEVNLPK